MVEMRGKTILVTGGTGSFGKAFIKRILKEEPEDTDLVMYRLMKR